MSVSGAVTVTVNLSKLLPINEVKQSTAPIWTSTGFSPPQDNPGWYKTSEMQQNVAMIAALPYNPFDFQVSVYSRCAQPVVPRSHATPSSKLPALSLLNVNTFPGWASLFPAIIIQTEFR